MGSLYTALAGFLQARSQNGKWHVRIDDIDPYRTIPGASDKILWTLESHGLYWDGPILYQSRRLEAYQNALEQLDAKGYLYPCTCTRKSLARIRKSAFYPGFCRNKKIADRNQAHALRVRTDQTVIVFYDELQGRIEQNLAALAGDFIIRRRDKSYAYQLACAVDDNAEHITQVLRGVDLLDSTPKQIHLQRLLGIPSPNYLHMPVLVDKEGNKLSKQTRAQPVDACDPADTLFYLLGLLNQSPPAELQKADCPTLIAWAIAHWDAAKLPKESAIVL